jgi:hypothetical protein
LRVLVPLIFAAAFMSGVAATFVHWSDGGKPFRLASLALLVAFAIHRTLEATDHAAESGHRVTVRTLY